MTTGLIKSSAIFGSTSKRSEECMNYFLIFLNIWALVFIPTFLLLAIQSISGFWQSLGSAIIASFLLSGILLVMVKLLENIEKLTGVS